MSEERPLSQEDIDAALAGLNAGDAGPAQPEAHSAVAGDDDASVEVAAGQGAAGEARQSESAAASANESAGGDFSQDDVDALLNNAETSANKTGQHAKDGAQPAASTDGDQSSNVELDSAGRPFDEAAAEMAAAIAEEKQANLPQASTPDPPAPLPPGAEPMSVPDLDSRSALDASFQSIELLKDVGLQVKIELGRSRMLVEDVLRLGEGSVVELDKLAGDPVDVYVNDRLVARGEVLVLNDNFCIRVNEIISDLSKEFQTA